MADPLWDKVFEGIPDNPQAQSAQTSEQSNPIWDKVFNEKPEPEGLPTRMVKGAWNQIVEGGQKVANAIYPAQTEGQPYRSPLRRVGEAAMGAAQAFPLWAIPTGAVGAVGRTVFEGGLSDENLKADIVRLQQHAPNDPTLAHKQALLAMPYDKRVEVEGNLGETQGQLVGGLLPGSGAMRGIISKSKALFEMPAFTPTSDVVRAVTEAKAARVISPATEAPTILRGAMPQVRPVEPVAPVVNMTERAAARPAPARPPILGAEGRPMEPTIPAAQELGKVEPQATTGILDEFGKPIPKAQLRQQLVEQEAANITPQEIDQAVAEIGQPQTPLKTAGEIAQAKTGGESPSMAPVTPEEWQGKVRGEALTADQQIEQALREGTEPTLPAPVERTTAPTAVEPMTKYYDTAGNEVRRGAMPTAEEATAQQGLTPRWRTISGSSDAPLSDVIKAQADELERQFKEVRRKTNVGALSSAQASNLLWRNMRAMETAVMEGRPAETIGPKVPGFNLDTINAPEDIQRIIKVSAETQQPLIEGARGRAINEAELRAFADQSGLNVKDLLKHAKDTPFSDVEVVRYKGILQASSANVRSKLSAYNQAELGAKGAAQDELRQALGKHAMIAGAFAHGRAETGRALKAFQTMPSDTLNDIADMLRDISPNDMQVISRVAVKAIKRTWWDKTMFLYVNAFLTNPLTHLHNIISNTSVLPLIPLRKLAAGRPTEAYYTALSMLNAFNDEAMSAALKAFKTKVITAGLPEERLAKLGIAHTTPKLLEAEKNAVFFGGKADKYIGTPGNALAAEDEFFRTVIAQGELGAQAVKAAKLKGLSRGTTEWDNFIKDAVINPSDQAVKASWDAAEYNTFNNKMGTFGQKYLALRRNRFAKLGEAAPLEMLTPFTTTPVNLAKFGIEHSPLGFAKLMFASTRTADELAKPIVGSAALLGAYFGWKAFAGNITGRGPSDPGQRAVWLENHKPYTLEFPRLGLSFNYAWLDPLATPVGFITDLFQGIKELQQGQENGLDASQIAKAAEQWVGSVGKGFINKSWFQNLYSLTQVLSDPQRYGESFAKSIVNLGQPGAGVAAIARAADPYQRDTNAFNTLANRIPLASTLLRPKLGILGKPVENPGGPTGVAGFANRLLNPFTANRINRSPLARSLETAGYGYHPANQTMNGIHLSDEALFKFNQASGAKFEENLRDLVDTPAFQDADKETQKGMIKQALSEARTDAKFDLVDQGVIPETVLQPKYARQP